MSCRSHPCTVLCSCTPCVYAAPLCMQIASKAQQDKELEDSIQSNVAKLQAGPCQQGRRCPCGMWHVCMARSAVPSTMLVGRPSCAMLAGGILGLSALLHPAAPTLPMPRDPDPTQAQRAAQQAAHQKRVAQDASVCPGSGIGLGLWIKSSWLEVTG